MGSYVKPLELCMIMTGIPKAKLSRQTLDASVINKELALISLEKDLSELKTKLQTNGDLN